MKQGKSLTFKLIRQNINKLVKKAKKNQNTCKLVFNFNEDKFDIYQEDEKSYTEGWSTLLTIRNEDNFIQRIQDFEMEAYQEELFDRVINNIKYSYLDELRIYMKNKQEINEYENK